MNISVNWKPDNEAFFDRLLSLQCFSRIRDGEEGVGDIANILNYNIMDGSHVGHILGKQIIPYK